MINEKHLVLTSHTKFFVLISNRSGILLHNILNQNERKKNEETKGVEEEDKGKKEGGKEAQTISSSFLHKEIPNREYLCTEKSYYVKKCDLWV